MNRSAERRNYIRHPLSYPFRTRIIHEGHALHGEELHSESENIGDGGLQFKSDRALPKGTEVEMDLSVENRRFKLDGKVVRCKRIAGDLYNIAVSFHSPSELLKARMMEQVVRIELFKQRLERRYGVKIDFGWLAREWIRRYSSLFAKQYDL